MKLNEKLVELRKRDGLSQEELGEKLNVTRQTVSNWELGMTTPEMDRIVEISKIYNVTVDELIDDSKKISNKKKSKNIVVKIIVIVLICVIIFSVAGLIFLGNLFGGIFNMFKKQQEEISNIGNDMFNNTTSLIDQITDVSDKILDEANDLKEEKTSITVENFKNIMEGKGYVTTNAISLFVQYGDYFKNAYVAKKDNYQIEFYELSTVENAMDTFNTNKLKFEAQKTGKSSVETLNKNNFSKYSLTTEEKFKYVSRIDKTLIYLDVDIEYKDVVESILNELGY